MSLNKTLSALLQSSQHPHEGCLVKAIRSPEKIALSNECIFANKNNFHGTVPVAELALKTANTVKTPHTAIPPIQPKLALSC